MKRKIVSFVLALLMAFGLTACSDLDSYDDAIEEEDLAFEEGNYEIEPLEIPDIVLYNKGDKGEGVQAIQQKLIDAGFLNDTADGSFGPLTKEAVEALQESLGVEVTGDLTSHALLALYEEYVSGDANLRELQKTDDDDYVLATLDAYNNGELGGKSTYIRGRILFVVDYDSIVIETNLGELWCLSLNSPYDFTEYEGTECEVFGKIHENTHKESEFPTMYLVDGEKAGIWFVDGRRMSNTAYRDDDFESKYKDSESAKPQETPEPTPAPTSTPKPQNTPAQSNTDKNSGQSSGNSVTVPDHEETQGHLVWVPVNGGTKYHSKSSCSNMENPIQVSIETAKANGYTACGRCH